MRVGMDYRPAMRFPTGIGRYASSLAAAFGRTDGIDLVLYGIFRNGNRRATRVAPPGTRLVGWRVPSRLMRALHRGRLLTTERVLGGCDLFHHTNFILPELAPSTPQVMTIHDVAFLHDRGYHTPRAAGALEGVVARARERCGLFLVPSEATARDCHERLGIPEDRLRVTPLGVDASWFDLPAPAAPPHPRPYVLAVGTLEPRKNYPRLIRAFAGAGLDADLLIAGGDGWLFEEIHALAAATPGVHLLGRVPEPRLRALLAGARGVAYCSLLEGFGLPVLEALAAGKPVLTSDREPFRSVAGDAAVRVDPEDVDALADGLRRLLGPDGRAAAAHGPARARRFTWEECAGRTLAAYRDILE